MINRFVAPPPRLHETLMNNDMITRRLVEAGALLLIADGVMGLLKPRWHGLVWHFGPQIAKAATEELADHPKTARSIYGAEIALGLLLACSQQPDDE